VDRLISGSSGWPALRATIIRMPVRIPSRGALVAAVFGGAALVAVAFSPVDRSGVDPE